MVLPATKLLASESVPASPDNSVAPVIGAGIVAWLLAAAPAIPSGGWAAMAPKPSAANAAESELVTLRLVPLLVCSAITPSLTVDGVVVPESASIFVSSVWTLSVVLTWLLPTAPEATKEIGLPLTVIVSPGAKLAASESVLAGPDNSVAPLIDAGGAALLSTAVPATVPAELKKSLPASTADAATSEVLASVPIAEVSAAFRLAAVIVEVAPIAKLPVGCGVALEAVS